jgi:DNA-binding MarR family transcriptional regulator
VAPHLLETTYLLTALQRAHRARLEPRLATLRLHPGADLALAEISRHEGLAQGELARRLWVRPPSITKVVRGLERRGLVERMTDPDDARVSRVYPTPEGRRVSRAVERAWRAAERDTLAALSGADVTALRELLARAVRLHPTRG